MIGKNFSRTAVAIATVGLICGVSVTFDQAQAANLAALKELGKQIFFDPISRPRGKQSCSSCHDPAAGWTGPKAKINKTIVAQPGAAFHRSGGTAIGSLKPPSNAYASFSPPFAFTEAGFGCPDVDNPICYVGGNFWDGRSEGNGSTLNFVFPDGATEGIGAEVFRDEDGNLQYGLRTKYEKFLGPVAEQALNPFPNEVEQNIGIQQVCRHVKKADYAVLFERAWNEPIKCNKKTDGIGTIHYEKSFKRIAVALAAWQASKEVNSFSSKRDKELKKDNDDTPGDFPLKGFTDLENWGHDLFYAAAFNPLPAETQSPCEPLAPGSSTGPTTVPKAANCSLCHSANPDNVPDPRGIHPKQLYADHRYHNIGIPHNPVIPFDPTSPGLAGHSGNVAHTGEFKTPTLRNVDKRKRPNFVKAYGHNGWFKGLESIVHFYNTANVNGATANSFGITRCPEGVVTEKDALKQNCWPAPEHAGRPPIIGDLGLNTCDERAIVAYLKTLTDKKTVKPPKPFKKRRK